MKQTVVALIEFYQKFLSFDTGLLKVFAPGGACRYSPTCSEYTKRVILKYGVLKGLKLGGLRILSCNPFSNLIPANQEGEAGVV